MSHVANMSDGEILQTVADAATKARDTGDNWVDYLPDGIEAEDRYVGDAWYIGTLPDGRTIWLSREDREGPGQYSIVAPEN